MKYTIPLRITVNIESEETVVAAVKAETQRQFETTDEEWKARDQPAVDENFGKALTVLVTSGALCGAITGILERTVPALTVTGVGVYTSEVVIHGDEMTGARYASNVAYRAGLHRRRSARARRRRRLVDSGSSSWSRGDRTSAGQRGGRSKEAVAPDSSTSAGYKQRVHRW